MSSTYGSYAQSECDSRPNDTWSCSDSDAYCASASDVEDILKSYNTSWVDITAEKLHSIYTPVPKYFKIRVNEERIWCKTTNDPYKLIVDSNMVDGFYDVRDIKPETHIYQIIQD